MKAKIQGIEYEGTADEMAKLVTALALLKKDFVSPEVVKKEHEAQKVVVVKQEVSEKKGHKYAKKRKFKTWTPEEIQMLKDMNADGKTVKRIAKELKRTQAAVKVRLSLNKMLPNHRKVSKAHFAKDESGKPLIGARLWIDRKAKSLIKEYGYDYEKARIMAKDEWMSARKKFGNKKTAMLAKPEPSPSPGFPSFQCLSRDSNIILESMLKNSAKYNNPIRWHEAGLPLQLEGIGQWHGFVREFLQKNTEINEWVCRAVGKRGKFKVDTKDAVIYFEGV